MRIFEITSQTQSNLEISFNSNFLEANVVNIFLLLAGLIYVLRKFLGSILDERENKVKFAIGESEERVEQANIRLSEAQKQLEQTQIIISEIIKEAESTAKRVRQSILDQGKSDIEKLTISSKASIKSAENQVRLQIQQQVASLAIKKVQSLLQSQMTPTMQNKIIDKSILQLKDKGRINI